MAVCAWSEIAWISIAPQGYGELTFQAITETIDPDIGEWNVEWIPTLSGGRCKKSMPQEDTTITLEMYPVEVGTSGGWPDQTTTTSKVGNGVFDIFDGVEDTSQPLSVIVDRTTRLPIRMTILWTDDETVTDATQQIASGGSAERFSFADGYLTAVKPSFTDGVLKFTVTAKFPASDKDGNGCQKYDSTDGSATMAALNRYTATTKF
jgi:hypothetical protein